MKRDKTVDMPFSSSNCLDTAQNEELCYLIKQPMSVSNLEDRGSDLAGRQDILQECSQGMKGKESGS